MLTPSDLPNPPGGAGTWQPGDLEAIRRALLIPAIPQAIRAIQAAMAMLEDSYPAAIPTARADLQAITELDQQLEALSSEQLQSPIEIRRIGAAPGVIRGGEAPPIAKADVIEYATDLLKEEITTRYAAGTAPALVLQQRRVRHGQALLLMLPLLASWSRDPWLQGPLGSGAYGAAMVRS